jgi:hypothetical protein
MPIRGDGDATVDAVERPGRITEVAELREFALGLRVSVTADSEITLVYSVNIYYTEPPNNDPSLECDL